MKCERNQTRMMPGYFAQAVRPVEFPLTKIDWKEEILFRVVLYDRIFLRWKIHFIQRGIREMLRVIIWSKLKM